MAHDVRRLWLRDCRSLHPSGESEAAELSNFTPSFLWLLRDFYLTLEEEGRTVGGRSPCWCMQQELFVDSGMSMQER